MLFTADCRGMIFYRPGVCYNNNDVCRRLESNRGGAMGGSPCWFFFFLSVKGSAAGCSYDTPSSSPSRLFGLFSFFLTDRHDDVSR